jgi:hypothetical protein
MELNCLECKWYEYINERKYYCKSIKCHFSSIEYSICTCFCVIDFQTDVVKFVTQHACYRAHELCRNDQYRYRVFKQIRNQSGPLEDLTRQFLDALKYTSGMERFPRELIEQSVGVHFLQHPSLFFELMDFYSLQGTIYD